MSLRYLKEAAAGGDSEKLIRYVRLHLSDGDETAGRKEIDKAWVEALSSAPSNSEASRQFPSASRST